MAIRMMTQLPGVEPIEPSVQPLGLVRRPSNMPLDGPAAARPDDRAQQRSLKAVVASANQALSALEVAGRELKVSVDDDTKQVVVRVMNTVTNEVVRQIPSEVALRHLRDLKSLKGLLCDIEI